MYSKIADFLATYGHETQTTSRVMAALTDSALSQPKAEGHMNLGELAWHIVSDSVKIVNQAGLDIPETPTPAPLTAAAIQAECERTSAAIQEQAKSWTDEDMQPIINVFGYELPRGVWLNMLINHEVHHRGQVSVLMRQAGLVVPSIYGPNKEETDAFMAKMAAGSAGA